MCSVTQLLLVILNLMIWIVVASAIFSWLYAFNVVNPRNQFIAMIGNALYQLTEPLYRPIRRFLPDLGGLDLSPVIVLLIIFFLDMLIRNNLVPMFCF
ncbi:YggT family protein [Rhodobium gokarnense]|uniref:YggT family protein n=1 Tax=Rhodobium gokarnense TaxID=364296 RepID=A0ABT3HE10_9HYPH|nr:YggT family protein [Rhodobium gokarnense]MCW2308642.1 YggT family protein [Rhodobium gokarnense]